MADLLTEVQSESKNLFGLSIFYESVIADNSANVLHVGILGDSQENTLTHQTVTIKELSLLHHAKNQRLQALGMFFFFF